VSRGVDQHGVAMEKSTNPYRDILTTLVMSRGKAREAAYQTLFGLSKSKDFVNDLASAITRHDLNDRVMSELFAMFLEYPPFPSLWLAVSRACRPQQLANLAPFVGMTSELLGTDAKQAFGKAVAAMEPSDQLLAITCLARAEPDAPQGWGDLLFNLAQAHEQSTLALVTIACEAGERLSRAQWDTIVKALVAKYTITPDRVMMLVLGIRRTAATAAANGWPFELSDESWKTLFSFLLIEHQHQALLSLLSSGPNSSVPAGLLALLERALKKDGWEQHFQRRAWVVDVDDEVRIRFDFTRYLSIRGFATPVLVSLAAKKSDAIVCLLRAVTACPGVPEEELVSMIVCLGESGIAVDQAVITLLVRLARPFDDAAKSRAAIGLVRAMRNSRRMKLRYFNEILTWLPKATPHAQLEAWSCVLQFAESAPTAGMWSTALACAKSVSDPGRLQLFVEAVLCSIDAQDPGMRAPGDIVVATFDLAARHQCLGDAFKLLNERKLTMAAAPLLQSIGTSLEALIASNDWDAILAAWEWMAQMRPQLWTQKAALFAKAISQAGGVLLLIKLVARLYQRRIGHDAVWSVLVQWADNLHGDADKQVARIAVGLVLIEAAADKDEPWCKLIVPSHWLNDHLARLGKRHVAREWLSLLLRIESAPLQLATICKRLLMLAFERGQLLPSMIDIVQAARAGWRSKFASIAWDVLFLGPTDQQRERSRMRVATEPVLGDALVAWTTSLGDLVRRLIGRKDLDAAKLRSHLMPVLAACLGKIVPSKAAAGGTDPLLEAIDAVFGPAGEPALVASAILERLVTMKRAVTAGPLARTPLGKQGPLEPPDAGAEGPAMQFSVELHGHLLELIKLAAAEAADKPCLDAFCDAHDLLRKLIDSPLFARQYADLEFLTVEVLDNSDVDSLFLLDLGPAASGKATLWAARLLSLLAGPCTAVVVRREDGAAVAYLSCAVVLADGNPQPSLMCTRMVWHPSWDEPVVFPLTMKFAALGLAMISVLRSLAKALGIEYVHVDRRCFFASPQWPASSRKLVFLHHDAVWWQQASPTSGPTQMDVFELPLDPG